MAWRKVPRNHTSLTRQRKRPARSASTSWGLFATILGTLFIVGAALLFGASMFIPSLPELFLLVAAASLYVYGLAIAGFGVTQLFTNKVGGSTR